MNVRHQLGLDTVLLVVANQPWQKTPTREVTPARDRLAVLEEAIDGVEGVEASAMEIERGGPSYTADTLEELSRLHPGAELFLILGSDLVAELPTWERADEVRQRATLVVIRRPGACSAPPPASWDHIEVEVPALDISSTDLRRRAREGRPLDFLVPPGAVRCIRRLGLYAVER